MHAASRGRVIAAVLATGMLACAGAAPSPHFDASTAAVDTAAVSLQRTCETALARLDVRIATSSADAGTSTGAVLTEARALREEAVELMATGDYDVALDLIRSALALFETGSE
jgi:hypothetical protein